MNPVTKEPQATESYATFWEPVAQNAPPAPAPVPPADAKDADREFVNVPEDAPGAPRAERT